MVAAALGLRPQQHEIVIMRIGLLGVAHQLLGHDGDGGERRAEAVRRGGGKAVERRNLLLAREHQLAPRRAPSAMRRASSAVRHE